MSTIQAAAISTDTSGIAKKVLNNMEFVSIQDEKYRVYKIPSKFGIQEVIFDEPQWLFVRPSGTHLVIDKAGRVHYVPYFVHLYWYNGENTPANF